jgi:hypothetical protein
MDRRARFVAAMVRNRTLTICSLDREEKAGIE